MSGIDGRYPEVKAWLKHVLPNFANYAHMLGLPSMRLAGDSLSSCVFESGDFYDGWKPPASFHAACA